MGTRGWILWALSSALFAACVGDDPQGGGNFPPEAGTSSGGSSGVLVDAPPSAFTLTVEPLEITRGDAGVLRIHVARSTLVGPVQLRTGNKPAGIVAPEEAQIAADADTLEMPVQVTAQSGYGAVSFQLTATLAGITSTVDAQLFVRGVQGALDTSFGVGGRAAPAPNAQLVDAARREDGSLVVVGTQNNTGAGLLRVYTAEGAADARVAPGGASTWNGVAGSKLSRAGELSCGATNCSFLGLYERASEFYAVDGTIDLEDGAFSFPSQALPAHSIAPTTYAGFPLHLARQGDQVLFARGGSEYAGTNSTMDLYAADGSPVRPAGGSWPAVFGNAPTRPVAIPEVGWSGSHAFVLLAEKLDSSTGVYKLLVLDRLSGVVTYSNDLMRFQPATPLAFQFSPAFADGSVLLSQISDAPSRRLCLMRVTTTGKQVFGVDCNFSTPALNRARPFPLRDGRIAVVESRADGGRLHILSADGSLTTEADGIPLEGFDAGAVHMLHAFEDDVGRLVLVARGASWWIARYWIR